MKINNHCEIIAKSAAAVAGVFVGLNAPGIMNSKPWKLLLKWKEETS